MRFQHRFGALFFLRFGGEASVLFHLFAFRSDRPIRVNIENLVESESGKKFSTALTGVDDMKMALPQLLQSQRDRRHCSHESGIHHRAIFQIDHKLAITAVDHLLREFLEAPAVEEVALPFHSNPNGGTVYAH